MGRLAGLADLAPASECSIAPAAKRKRAALHNCGNRGNYEAKTCSSSRMEQVEPAAEKADISRFGW